MGGKAEDAAPLLGDVVLLTYMSDDLRASFVEEEAVRSALEADLEDRLARRGMPGCVRQRFLRYSRHLPVLIPEASGRGRCPSAVEYDGAADARHLLSLPLELLSRVLVHLYFPNRLVAASATCRTTRAAIPDAVSAVVSSVRGKAGLPPRLFVNPTIFRMHVILLELEPSYTFKATITISDIHRRRVDVPFAPSDKIQHVRARAIAAFSGGSRLALFFKGTRLADGHTLASYDITKNDVIHCDDPRVER